MRQVETGCRIWRGAVKRFGHQIVDVLLVFLAFGINCACLAAGSSKVDGYYIMPSKYCTQYSGGRFVSCQKTHTDCMLLKQQSEDSMHLEIYSSQADGHVCGLNGTAHIQGNRLIYREPDAQNREWALEILVSDRSFELKYLSHPGHQAPFCGVHASLDGVKFDRNKTRKREKACFVDE